MSNTCGGCINFIKFRSDRGEVYAICEFLDCRTKSDYGHNCKHFSPLHQLKRIKWRLKDALE